MEFSFGITIEPNTTEDEPKRLQCKLAKGRLVAVDIFFPWGCGGAVGVRIIHYEHQLYPTNPDEWFTGNDIHIHFECNRVIEEGASEFKVEGYNECDFYNHTPVVSFNILEEQPSLVPVVSWVEA